MRCAGATHGSGAPAPKRDTTLTRSLPRSVLLTGSVLILGLAASSCASHRFVRDNVAVVDARVDQTDANVTQVAGTAGEALTRANVRSIRPGNGLAPVHLEAVLGKRAARDIARGEPLAWEMVAK